MPDIKEWIHRQLKASVPLEKIKQGLIEGGYNPNLVNEVLTENTKGRNTNLIATLMPQQSNIKIILLVILLAGTSFVFGGALAFSLLNTDIEPETIVRSTPLTYDELVELNPKLDFFTRDTECKGGLGDILAFTELAANEHQRLAILVFNDEVIGMLSIWPASEGWAFYANQQEGESVDIDGVSSYTQTIFLKTSPTTEDCASAQG